MAGHELTCELIVPAPIGDVFAFFQNPYNLSKITPPSLGFRILTPDLVMRVNAEIDYEFRWLGVPMRWRTVISQYEPPLLFVDVALSSPYSYWRHHHTFRETPKGTLVADRVEYALPYGVLGRIAHSVVVRQQLMKVFAFRQQAIGTLLSTRPIELHPPMIVAA